MKNDLLEKGAIVQRDRETYALVPHFVAGLITPEQLRKLADVAEKYNAKAIKITAAQRMAIVGFQEDDIDNVWNELAQVNMKPASAGGLCVRSIKVCPGSSFCKRGLQDSVVIGEQLDKIFSGRVLPSKLKMGVSGCPNSCGDSHTRDVGIIGGGKGWMVVVGGKGGTKPRIGNKIALSIPTHNTIAFIEKIVTTYEDNAKKKERLGDYIDRIGFENFKTLVDVEAYL